MNISSNKNCIECRACVQICAKSAIDMCQNEEGFSYPVVDTNTCTDCGLCTKVCPTLHSELVKWPTGKVYAAQSNDDKTLMGSSSGGVFTLIAEYVIKKLDGIVYGAAWDEGMQLHHIGVERLDDLAKLRGSKYVHSDIGHSFNEIRDYLRNGRWVYFVGTPCQVAGLRLFLRKEYETLLTSDLICHGTPSQKLFNMFLHQIELERNGKVIDYNFRDKKVFGWTCASSSSSLEKNGKSSYLFYDKNMRSYFNAFLKGHITRQDCYECKFACTSRVGDITLADYWGINKQHPEFPQIRKGVSLILVNSKKGESVIDTIRNKMILFDSTIEKVLQTTNHNLHSPTPKPAERNDAYKRAFKDFLSFRDSYIQDERPESYYRRIYIKSKIKKMPLVKLVLRIIKKNNK